MGLRRAAGGGTRSLTTPRPHQPMPAPGVRAAGVLDVEAGKVALGDGLVHDLEGGRDDGLAGDDGRGGRDQEHGPEHGGGHGRPKDGIMQVGADEQQGALAQVGQDEAGHDSKQCGDLDGWPTENFRS